MRALSMCVAAVPRLCRHPGGQQGHTVRGTHTCPLPHYSLSSMPRPRPSSFCVMSVHLSTRFVSSRPAFLSVSFFVRRRRCCTSVRGCGRRRPPSTSRSRPSHRPHASWGRSRCPSCTRNTLRCGSNEHLHTLPLSPAVPDMLISWCVRSEIKLPLSLFFSLPLTPSLCISPP